MVGVWGGGVKGGGGRGWWVVGVKGWWGSRGG